ncbi:PTS sugar transporter subunit IIA [bacterium]|nr:PTS sugar transporter subunit IIA [bacterium]
MRLSDFLSEETITTNVQSADKETIIDQLLDLCVHTGAVLDRETVRRDVLKREELMSTGLEGGVAVPHAKTGAVGSLTMALGIARDGIDFDSADGKPSTVFFFILAPESEAGKNVQLLAQIARLTRNSALCSRLVHASTPREALKVIRDAE